MAITESPTAGSAIDLRWEIKRWNWLAKMVKIMGKLLKIKKNEKYSFSRAQSSEKRNKKQKQTFNEFWSFLFLCAYLVRQSNIIVRYYASSIDYLSNFFSVFNVYISSPTKISVNNWKFPFHFYSMNLISYSWAFTILQIWEIMDFISQFNRKILGRNQEKLHRRKKFLPSFDS